MPLVPTLAFLALLSVFLVIDLGLLNRKAHSITASQAFRQAGVWVMAATAFAGVIYTVYENHHFGFGLADRAVVHDVAAPGPDSPPGEAGGRAGPAAAPEAPVARDPMLPHDGKEATVMFATGYLLEMMLSLDNMMVIAIIMTYFKVPAAFQHRALFWGIIGAVALRGAMIGLGATLVTRFDWILYVFGGFLLLTAIKLFFESEDESPDLEKNIAVRVCRALLPVSATYDGSRFFTRVDGALAITPLMLALVTIDVADAIFAVDSIPAAFSATKDPFLVLTSNCFAILGLRAIYFAVAAITEKFRFLKQSMILILAFIGVKMLLPLAVHLPFVKEAGWSMHLGSVASLSVIAALMGGGIALSMALPPQAEGATDDPGPR